MTKSAKSKLVNHKLKTQQKQRNGFKATPPLDTGQRHYLNNTFLSLIFLFFFYIFFPLFLMVLAEILEKKRREKKRENGWMPSVGNQGHL